MIQWGVRFKMESRYIDLAKHLFLKRLSIAAATLAAFSSISVEAAETEDFSDIPISRVSLDELSDEQKALIRQGQISTEMKWINNETGHEEWITDFVLVYRPTGNCEVVPGKNVIIPPTEEEGKVPPTPQETLPPQPDKDTPPPTVADVVAKTTGIPKSSVVSVLPATGELSSNWLYIPGIGLLALAGYLAYRNKASRKLMLVAVLAGSVGASTTALAATPNFLEIVETVRVKMDERFNHTAAESSCWEYVGYIPHIASKPKTPPVVEVPEATIKSISSEIRGTVIVHYVDTAGNTIAPDVVDVNNELVATVSGTQVEGEEPELKTETTGLTYDTSEHAHPVIEVNGKRYRKIMIKEGDIESGLVVEGTTHVTYIYELMEESVPTDYPSYELPEVQVTPIMNETRGSVHVHYMSTDGVTLANPRVAVDNAVVTITSGVQIGEDTSALETERTNVDYDTKPFADEFITHEGTRYRLVQVKEGDIESGLVVEGTTNVTYLYEPVQESVPTDYPVVDLPSISITPINEEVRGSVVVHYVDQDGNSIADDVTLVDNGLVSTTTGTQVEGETPETTVTTTDLSYDTTPIKHALIDKEGIRYQFVMLKEGDVESALVKEGVTHVTYIYQPVQVDKPTTPPSYELPEAAITPLDPIEERGSIIVRYKDTEGNVIAPENRYVDNGLVSRTNRTQLGDASEDIVEDRTETGERYDTTPIRHETITFQERVYDYTRVEGVETAILPTGETVVTYIYTRRPIVTTDTITVSEEKGTVIVRYEDEDGNPIKDPFTLVDDQVVSTTTRDRVLHDGQEFSSSEPKKTPSGLTYDTTPKKDTEIRFEDRDYVFARAKDATPEQGTVPVGTTVVTYVYRKLPIVRTEQEEETVTGNVIVRYVNTEGEVIKEEVKVVENGEVSKTTTTKTYHDEVLNSSVPVTVESGLEYNTTEHKDASITKDSKEYTFKELKADSAPETGKVKAGDTIVTYVYELVQPTIPKVEETTGNVVVRYYDTDGSLLSEYKHRTNAPVGEGYYTVANMEFDAYLALSKAKHPLTVEEVASAAKILKDSENSSSSVSGVPLAQHYLAYLSPLVGKAIVLDAPIKVYSHTELYITDAVNSGGYLPEGVKIILDPDTMKIINYYPLKLDSFYNSIIPPILSRNVEWVPFKTSYVNNQNEMTEQPVSESGTVKPGTIYVDYKPEIKISIEEYDPL